MVNSELPHALTQAVGLVAIATYACSAIAGFAALSAGVPRLAYQATFFTTVACIAFTLLLLPEAVEPSMSDREATWAVAHLIASAGALLFHASAIREKLYCRRDHCRDGRASTAGKPQHEGEHVHPV